MDELVPFDDDVDDPLEDEELVAPDELDELGVPDRLAVLDELVLAAGATGLKL